jgi:hypothetical protein
VHFHITNGGAFTQAEEHAKKITKDDVLTKNGYFQITFE